MSAPKYDIELAQGETFYTALTLDESEAVMDLTGYAFEGQIRATPESPTVLANFGFDESRLASGTVAITLSAAVTESLPVRACVYDLFMTSPAGIRTQLLKGSVLVSMRITRC
jgi:hypothetical protein